MKSSNYTNRVRKYSNATIISLFVILFISLIWNIISNSQQIKRIAKLHAEIIVDNDIAFMSWITAHGGLYSPSSEGVKLSPLLSYVPQNKIQLTNQDSLILINPAHLLKQFRTGYSDSVDIKIKIVSLNPFSKNNRPDMWEDIALKKINKGEKVVSEFIKENGTNLLRLVKPLIVEEGCLKCHSVQQYKVGEVRGGVSIKFPVHNIFNSAISKSDRIIYIHIAIFILGLIGIKLLTYRFIKKNIENEKIRNRLLENSAQLKLTLDATEAGTWDWNIKTGEIVFNERWAEIVGYTLEELQPINIDTWNRLVHPDDLIELDKLLEEHFKRKTEHFEFETRMAHKRGGNIWVLISGKVVEWIEEKEPKRMVGIILDITEQKKMVENLKLSEEKYRLLAENIIGILWQIDLDFNLQFINQGAKQLLGYTIEEISQINAKEVFPEDEFLKIKKAIEEEISRGPDSKGVSLESVHIHKNGTHIPVEISGKVIFNSDGEPIGISGYTHDISERKKVEEVLKTANEQFSTIMNSLDSVVYVADMKTYELIFINSKLEKEVGDIIGEKCWEVLQKDQKGPCEFCTNDKLISEDGRIGEVYKWEFQNTRTKRWYLIHDKAIKWYDGRVVRLEIATDITERKINEKALIDSENRFRTTFNQALNPTIIAKVEDSVIPVIYDINQATITYLGYSREELIGAKITKIHSKEKISEIKERVAKVFAGENIQFETTHTTKEGKVVPVQISAKTITINDEKFIYIVELDISERKKWEKDILKIQKKLKDEIVSKDRFFSIISHDLKSPFGALLGVSQLLEESYEVLDNSERKELIKVARKSAVGIFELLESLLEWARANLGKMEYNPQEVSLSKIANIVTEVFISSAARKEITLINNVPNGLTVFADENMIRTILRNLIANAIKFTHRGGKIILSAKENKDNFEISVNDNGIGISAEDIEKLFRIDKKVSTAGTEKESGTGVGLILCKELVNLHNGDISVASQLGTGSTFVFTIPKFNS